MRCALVFLILAGCASAPQTLTVDRPVLIPGPTQYVPIPVSMLQGCVSPGLPGPTNGDLLVHDHAMTAFASCLQDQLTEIKALR